MIEDQSGAGLRSDAFFFESGLTTIEVIVEIKEHGPYGDFVLQSNRAIGVPIEAFAGFIHAVASFGAAARLA